MASASLHDIDIMTWADEQAREIRDLAKRPNLSNMLDWLNLAEEIESVGRSQVSGVKRKLVLMIAHLLKILSAPNSPASKGWRSEIGSFQKLLQEEFSPSMRRLIEWDHIWVSAVEQAQASLSLWGDELIGGLPTYNPLRLDDLVGAPFDLQAALASVASSIQAD